MKKFLILLAAILLVAGVSFYVYNSGIILPDQSTDETSDDNALPDRINSEDFLTLAEDPDIFDNVIKLNTDNILQLNDWEQFIELLAKSYSVKASYSDNENLKLEVSSFDKNKLISALITNDRGFVSDVQNFYNLEVDETEIYDYVLKYVIRNLQDNRFSTAKSQNTYDISIVGKKLDSNENLVRIFNELSQNFIKDLTEAAKNNLFDENTIKDTKSAIKKCKIGDQIPVYVNTSENERSRALLCVKTVLSEKNAEDYVNNLSNSNKNLVLRDSDCLVVILYEVTNLENAVLKVPDNFAYVDSDLHCYKNFGNDVIGLHSSVKLDPGQTAELCTALVVPKDFDYVYWRDRYSDALLQFYDSASDGNTTIVESEVDHGQ